ncbi:8-oxoguanine DNA glycosylase N-terminal [Penicillium taxi]|uniref:8-oxoguanine DNA glycosylase N-terminal n=1 Tax=Penicillium taxi TaxID=168475 RepID=UPI00254597DB|nr:8-oxoguanine DNA glycosylase N-terminal [Penicillium taxi]KAJ5908051.1 8-oxoguanine DNA glycosylase N-terminal [Penicillium taxi]
MGTFSEWRKLSVGLSELCINTTLRCGQSFRWQNIPETGEWRCVLYGTLVSLRQDSEYLYYRTCQSKSPSILPTPPASKLPSRAQSDTNDDSKDDHIVRVLKHYLNLSPNLTELYAQWSAQDPNFKKKATQFSGIRILRQDPWEALVSFICSSNNNISRISQMVEKICLNYGPFVAKVDGRAYHDFPTPEALTGKDLEHQLRGLGFGYRAKYIYNTSVMVFKEEKGWLNSLCNPESPAYGLEAAVGDEMRPEGRQGYLDAHEKLLSLQGVGPKVADCVCLFGLGWGESVPVDTHVWQIAQRDYRFGKGSHKSLNKATSDAIANHFRKLWGQEAGWAHSVLFTADLRSFSDRLAATKKVDLSVKEDNDEDVKIKTEVTTTVTLAAVKEEPALKEETGDIKLEDSESKLVPTVPRRKRKEVTDTLVLAAQTTETRRVSKRLRQ